MMLWDSFPLPLAQHREVLPKASFPSPTASWEPLCSHHTPMHFPTPGSTHARRWGCVEVWAPSSPGLGGHPSLHLLQRASSEAL